MVWREVAPPVGRGGQEWLRWECSKKITSAFENVNVDILIEKYRELDIDEHTRYVIHRLFQYKHSVLKTGDNVVHQNNAGVSPDPTQF